ncbi:MAG TPA: hypothetical protein VKJ65_01970 [Phycisphaerae bacterium]|nr:hypothetical protein [Phycisphaerae bacterium]
MEALYLLDNDLVHWIKPGDPTLEFAYQHGKIGELESLIQLGNFDEVIMLGKKTDLSGMTKDEAAEFAFALGHALYLKQRYADAIPQFTICADDPTAKYSSLAWQYLIFALYHSGNIRGR